MFYIDCGKGLRLVGASPECLCKVEGGKVENHAIAGTVRRGRTAEGAFLCHLPLLVVPDRVRSTQRTLLSLLNSRAR